MAAPGHPLGPQNLIQELIGDGVVGDRAAPAGAAAPGRGGTAGRRGAAAGGSGGGAAGHILVPGGDTGGALGGLHLGAAGGHRHVVGIGGDIFHLARAGHGGTGAVGGDGLHRAALAYGDGSVGSGGGGLQLGDGTGYGDPCVGGGHGEAVYLAALSHGDAGALGLFGHGDGGHRACHSDLGIRPGYIQGAHGAGHDDGVGAVVDGDDLHRGVALDRQAHSAVPTLRRDGADGRIAHDNDGVLAAAPDHQGPLDGDVVQGQVPVTDALGGDQVAVDGHVGQGDPGSADNDVAMGVGGVAARLIIAGGNGVVQQLGHLRPGDGSGGHDIALIAVEDACPGHAAQVARGPVGSLGAVGKGVQPGSVLSHSQGPAQHDGGLLPGDGVQRPQGVAVALENTGGGSAQHPVLIPAVLLHIGIGGSSLGLIVHQTVQDHRQFSPGDGVVGTELTAVALEDLLLTPAVDGLLSPVAGRILIGQGGESQDQGQRQGQQTAP